MAEFVLRHGREVYLITARESPLDALRAGSLERACELADLFAPGLRALWRFASGVGIEGQRAEG